MGGAIECCQVSLFIVLLLANNQSAYCRLPSNSPTGYFQENSVDLIYDQHVTFDEYIDYAMNSLKLVAGYDTDLHRYDKNDDLINSTPRQKTQANDFDYPDTKSLSEIELFAGQSRSLIAENERNQLVCGLHLEALRREIDRLFSNFDSFSSSKNISLINYIDSFGSISPQLMRGNLFWSGSHDQCINSRPKVFINKVNGKIAQALKTRYCIANYQSSGWSLGSDEPESIRSGSKSIKVGVCLPESCNSISILRHSNLIDSIIKITRMNQLPFSNYHLKHLYCLPDEGSPLRQLSWSAITFTTSISIWILIVAYYSIKHEYLNHIKAPVEGRRYEIFSLRFSYNKLFDSRPERVFVCEPMESRTSANNFHQNLKLSVLPANQKSSDILKNLNLEVKNLPKVNDRQQIGVDLSCIDGIKVLSMIWLICAHTLLFLIRSIANGRDFWSFLRDARFLTIIAGIFPVDSFFTITGILTGFLKFNKADGHDMGRRSHWVEAFVHRYLRFMPMYLIVFWYTRDVSEYIGYGPFWDYATADTSLRSMCKQESIAAPLLFQANLKPLDRHCVKPAWYLANDYQYLLITPIYTALIMKSSLLGYASIALSIALSLTTQFLSVYGRTDPQTFDVLANFKPMFATYVLRDLWGLYVLPYNRVAPYLIGLLTGHLMYRANCKIRHESPEDRELRLGTSDETNNNRLSGLIKFWAPIIALVAIIYSPLTSKILKPIEGSMAQITGSSIIALLRLIWSLSIARLIYVCSTRLLHKNSDLRSQPFGLRFLSSPIWKPWSNIGLTVLLIQWEVIGYLIQTQTDLPNLTFKYLMALILLSVTITYSMAIPIYLTIEYPLSQIEHFFIITKLFGRKKSK